MGKLNIFEISLANNVCYAGTVLQGHLTVELNAPMKMRGIQVTIEGKAFVNWMDDETTGSGKNRKSETHHYYASENYFKEDILVHGIRSNQGSNTTELAAGKHTFPFESQLPKDLPSSYESEIGHVRYVVKGKIDKPWKFDHNTKKPFTLVSVLDLNSNPEYAQQVQGSNQKQLCCLCCKSGPIQASFHIDRKGYVPGEAIILNAEINNGASRSMDKSYVDLSMITSYHATTKTRTDTKEVARVTRPEIKGHSSDTWNGEQLVIPPVPPSFLMGCKLIDIRYVLTLNVDPAGPGLDLKVPLEIVIGTMPLISVVQQHPPLPPPDKEVVLDNILLMPSMLKNPPLPPLDSAFSGALNALSALPSDAASGLANLPQPSFGECITGKVDIHDDEDNEYTRGDFNFAPAYTYYNWGHTPTPMQGK